LFMRVADGHLFQREGEVAEQTQIAAEPVNAANAEGQGQVIPPAPATLTLPQVASLGRQISQNFNEDELRDFCLELGIDYEDLRGSSKSSKARELADYCRRQGLVPQLWQNLYDRKGHVQWQV
ncbi:MAG: hypothetical protein IAF02_03620, partial [Anaerolineae bacterium]|nr:hypothetical protein [Anaerolineae bacterium]